MNAVKKKEIGSGCPIKDAVDNLEKVQADFLTMLEKDSIRCGKDFESIKKKKAKLMQQKKSMAAKKKELTAKVKKKATAANKKQLASFSQKLIDYTNTLALVNDEFDGTKHGVVRLAVLLKHRYAEKKLVDKYRKDQQKIAEKKDKLKAKPTTKK